MRLVSALLVSVIAVLAAGGPALAQGMPCGERAALLEQLQSRYKESPTAIALTSQGQLLEVLVSPEGGWTILVTAPKGPTCLLAVGESWQTRPQLALDPGA